MSRKDRKYGSCRPVIFSMCSFFLAGLFFAGFCKSVNAASIETPGIKTGSPATQGEWDKLVTEAKKEGKVVIYAGTIGDARTALTNAFRQKYGISLDIVMGRGNELITKMASERRAGIYAVDVGIQGMTTYFNSVKSFGITSAPLLPLLVLPEVADLSKWRGGKLPFADREGHLIVLVLGPAPHLLINTELVKPGEINSHQDLLTSKWRGKLAINDPSLGGAGTEWFTFIVTKVMGLEKGTAFMKQLAKQDPGLTKDQRLLSEWVARGKYVAALAPDKATTAKLVRAGAPLAYPDLKEPRPTSSGPGNLMVLDRPPHPNAAKLFINWILSKEGAAVYSKAHGLPSTRIDVSTEGIDPVFIPKPDETILGEEYQVSKGEMHKLAIEVFRDITR